MTVAEAVTANYRRLLSELRDRFGEMAVKEWDALPAHDEGNLATFIARMQTTTDAARERATDLTSAYLDHAAPSALAVTLDDLPPFDPQETWRQPFISTWLGLKNGKSLEDAVASGRTRANTVGFDIVTDTSRDTMAFAASGNPQIIGWQWDAEAGCCDWCAERSDVSWDSTEREVFDSHDNCGCSISPITADAVGVNTDQEFIDSRSYTPETRAQHWQDAGGNPSGKAPRTSK